ncbi:tyramine receptor Ser-2-like [Dermatophagoides pteronyssinus]|uniref:tyramine receptor Ser-2-like n=1 Tax=Dermatophagoides pteronyssinus TaxID=6956 RepID=UPI003F67A4D3
MKQTTTMIDELPIIYVGMEACVAFIAIIGNLLVIIVFIQDRRLRKVTNFYIISLSFADLLVGSIGIPSAIMTKIGLPRGSMRLCVIMLSLLIILCTISILNLVAVSMDRYWAILHPLDYHKRISEKTALAIIFACWLVGSLIGLLPLFGWHNEYNDRCYFIPTMNYNFLMFLYFATIVFPAIIMAIFYIRIYIVVKQQLRMNKVRHLSISHQESSFITSNKVPNLISLATKTKMKKKFSKNYISDVIVEEEGSENNNNLDREQNSSIDMINNGKNIGSHVFKKHSLPHLINSRFDYNHHNQSNNIDHTKSEPNSRKTSTISINNRYNRPISIIDCTGNYKCSKSKWRSILAIMKFRRDVSKVSSPNDSIESIDYHFQQQQQQRNSYFFNNKLSYSRREVKKAQKLFIIVLFFMVCWIPLYTSNAFEAFCPQCPKLPASVLDFLIILSHINSAGSPFLYAFHMKDFRQALRRLICKGAFNQRKLRDLRREELFNVSVQQQQQRSNSNLNRNGSSSHTVNQNHQTFDRVNPKNSGIIHNPQFEHSSSHTTCHESLEHILNAMTTTIHSNVCPKSSPLKTKKTSNQHPHQQRQQKYHTMPLLSKESINITNNMDKNLSILIK